MAEGYQAAAGLDLLRAALTHELDGQHADWFVRPEELTWLSLVVEHIWPYAECAVREILLKDVASLVPGLSFPKFALGDTKPTLGPILGYHEGGRAGNVEMHITVQWNATPEITVQFGLLSAGVRHLRLRGSLCVSLKPLMSILPIVGGVSLQFTNPPDLEVDFTGAATTFPKAMVKDAVEMVLKELMVVPKCIFIDIAGITGVPRYKMPCNLASLHSPSPVAVLQLSVLAGQNLPASDASGSSDPYVVLTLGNQKAQTPRRSQTLNPEWGMYEQHNLLVYHFSQELEISVFDHDYATKDDLLGVGRKLSVQTLLKICGEGAWLDLQEAGGSKGQIRLKASVFVLKLIRIPRHILWNATVHCPQRHMLRVLKPAEIVPGRECNICGQSVDSMAGRFFGQLKGLVFGGEPNSMGACCDVCNFQVCRKCLAEKQQPVGVLRICLHTAKLPPGVERGSGDRLAVSILASGMGECRQVTKPAHFHASDTLDGTVANLVDIGGLSVDTISKCLSMPESAVNEALARRRDAESAFDMAWDEAMDFLVTLPLQQLRMKVEQMPAAWSLKAALGTAKGAVEQNVWQLLLRSPNKHSWHGAVRLDTGLVVSLSIDLLAMLPDQWRWRKGELCTYTSTKQGKTFLTKIKAVDPVTGSVQLELKPGEWIKVEDQDDIIFKFWEKGDACLYASKTLGKTFPTRITDVQPSTISVMVELKAGHWLSHDEHSEILSRYWEVGDACTYCGTVTNIADVDPSTGSVMVEAKPSTWLSLEEQVEVLSR